MDQRLPMHERERANRRTPPPCRVPTSPRSSARLLGASEGQRSSEEFGAPSKHAQRVRATRLSTLACSSPATTEEHHRSDQVPEVVPNAGIRICVDAVVGEETANESEENQKPVKKPIQEAGRTR